MSEELAQIFIDEGSKRFSNLNLLEWCERYLKLRIEGRVLPFTLKGHEPLRELYTIHDHPHIVNRKGAQLAVSTQNIARTFYLADKYSMKIGYYFPTDEDMQTYVQGRVDTMISDSDYLATAFENAIGANSTSIKQMAKSTIYFRGVFTKSKVKSIDLDYIIKDEVDEANQENLKFAEDRLLHSKFGWIAELSQPSIDDYGIDASFKKSDMRFWGIKCASCNHWNFPDETFPECLIKRGETTYLGCVKCSKKLSTNTGKWIPKFPERSKFIRGYHHSHLIYEIMAPSTIKKKFEEAKTVIEKKNLYISVLGLPYSSAHSKPITLEVLKKAERNYPVLHDAKFSFFGMDVGDICHIVFGHSLNGKLRVHYFQELDSNDEENIIRLIKRHGAYCGVIDAMPYKTLAKNIARAFPGRVYINYYKGDTLKASKEGEGIFEVPKVSVNRDESLDETCESLREQRIELPAPGQMDSFDLKNYETVKAQLQMLIKQPEDKDGVIEYHYKKGVPNHYGMALNYLRIASELAGLNVVSGVDPVFINLNL